MKDVGQKVEDMLGTMRTERDELRLQLHLLKAEARDEWQEIEDKWQRLEPKMKQLRGAAADSGDDIATAVGELAEEIKRGYQRLRRVLK